MKVYFVYIHNLEEDIYKKMDGSIYFNNLEIDEETKTYYGFYGFTKSKDRVKEFMKIHDKKYFSFKKKEISKEEYKDLKRKHIDYYIKPQEFICGKDKTVKISTTNFEHKSIDCDSEMLFISILEDFYDGFNLFKLPYGCNHRIFKDKYSTILEELGIGTFMDMMSGDESLTDMASYNLSFGKTSEGNFDLKFDYNTFNLYIYKYKPILFKGI